MTGAGSAVRCGWRRSGWRRSRDEQAAYQQQLGAGGDLADPAFLAEWERPALARAVAEAVIRYRAERGLSQSALAWLLGWRQPVVARLEAAEHNPSMDTL